MPNGISLISYFLINDHIMSAITAQNTIEFLKQFIRADGFDLVVDLQKSSGNKLYDARAKEFYLDCCAYFASNPIGHNHPKLFTKDFEEKLLRVARAKPSNSDFYTIEYAQFVDTIHRVAMPEYFKHLFFIEGGALGVENALKAAFDWKIRKNWKNGIKEEKGKQIIHFKEAFHGRTGYTVSLTNTADPRKTKLFTKFSWPRITNPKLIFPLDEKNLSLVKELEGQALYEIKSAFEEHGNDIAAIIIEPIQGEGGDNHFRKEFLQMLRKVSDENDVMLIFDEVQSGVGITGTMWAYEHFDVQPDIICFGKKMQVCGLMAGGKVDEVDNNVFKESSRINSTWGGNLTDMVRAQRYLEVIEEDKLVDNARVVGDKLLKELESLAQKFPHVISNARGRGLMCAIDFPNQEKRDLIQKALFKRKLIVLKCGDRSIRFRPALTFSVEEVQEVVAMLQDVVRE